MAVSPAGLLGDLAGGRVLDVGTGKGQFVQILLDELGSYTEIIGIDVSDAGADAFMQAFRARRSVRFVVADASAMPFEDESFDTRAICGSLHHLADPTGVLTEMRRVLRSGGAFILYEQVRDRPAAAELTHIRFHEWSELEEASDRRQIVRRGRAIRLRLHRVGIAVSPAQFLLGFKQ